MSVEKTTDYLSQSLGKKGSKSITGTDPVTPATGKVFGVLLVVADAVVSAQTDATGSTNADLSDFTALLAGTVIPTRLSSITLASGEMIGYYE